MRRMCVLLSVLGAIGTAASAQTTLQVDINGLSTEVDGVFSDSYTGGVHVFNTILSPDFDADTNILDVLIDGSAQNTGGATFGQFSFEILADFVNGSITGGSLTLSVDAFGSENTYSSNLMPTQDGSILDIGGGTFIIGGEFAGGDHWSNPSGSFLGVDIAPWGDADGFFAQIDVNFGGGLMDPDTDVDVFMVTPAPGTLGLLGLGGLFAVRRRR